MFTPAAPAAKKNFGQAVTTIIGLAVGIGCAEVVDLFGGFGATSVYIALLEIAVGLLLGFFLSIAAHEAGHLVFGLMTGYGFVSYRVGSLTIVRSDSKLKIRRMKLAGTGGQCLMSPPEMKDGKYPFVLYQLGGAIFNLVFSAVFIAVAFAVSGPQALRVILADIGLINLATALTNGIPLRLGAVDNDGTAPPSPRCTLSSASPRQAPKGKDSAICRRNGSLCRTRMIWTIHSSRQSPSSARTG